MIVAYHLKDIAIVLSILALLSIGLAITLKSGVMSVGRDRRRLILVNLSQMVVALMGWLVVLMMVQQIVGSRVGSPW